MKKQIKVPFWKDSGHHSPDSYQFIYKPKEFIDNYEFEALLKFKEFKWGSSAKNVIWIDENGKEYTSGISLLENTLNGKYPFMKVDCKLAIQRTFTFKKQGTSVLLTIKED